MRHWRVTVGHACVVCLQMRRCTSCTPSLARAASSRVLQDWAVGVERVRIMLHAFPPACPPLPSETLPRRPFPVVFVVESPVIAAVTRSGVARAWHVRGMVGAVTRFVCRACGVGMACCRRSETLTRLQSGSHLDDDSVVLTRSQSQPLMLTPLVSRAMMSNAALANPDSKYNIPWSSVTVRQVLSHVGLVLCLLDITSDRVMALACRAVHNLTVVVCRAVWCLTLFWSSLWT